MTPHVFEMRFFQGLKMTFQEGMIGAGCHMEKQSFRFCYRSHLPTNFVTGVVRTSQLSLKGMGIVPPPTAGILRRER